MQYGPDPPEELLNIWPNIERLRRERGLTAATVAERSGIPYPSSWYRKMNSPRLLRGDEFEAIAAVLGVHIGELFQ